MKPLVSCSRGTFFCTDVSTLTLRFEARFDFKAATIN